MGLLAAGWLNYNVYFNKQAADPAVYVAFRPWRPRSHVRSWQNAMTIACTLVPGCTTLRPCGSLPTSQPNLSVSLLAWHYSPFRKLGGGLEQPGFQFADPGLDLPLPDLGGDNAVFLLDQHFEYVSTSSAISILAHSLGRCQTASVLPSTLR